MVNTWLLLESWIYAVLARDPIKVLYQSGRLSTGCPFIAFFSIKTLSKILQLIAEMFGMSHHSFL
jgi:hypothetical protein